jgi:hypothetical protein
MLFSRKIYIKIYAIQRKCLRALGIFRPAVRNQDRISGRSVPFQGLPDTGRVAWGDWFNHKRR